MLEQIDTARDPVTTTYHGVDVTEDYRWLEDGDAERTKAWTAAQDARTRGYLATVADREPIRRRFEEILAVESTEYDAPRRGGDVWFALKTQPPLQQPLLVALEDLDDVGSERVLVDPNTLDGSGATTIDWFSPSPDGSLVAVSLSEHGTEDGTLHLYDVATGARADVTIPRVNSGTAGGAVAWRGDSTGYWYTRHPGPDERPESDLGFFQDVWFHRLATPVAHDTRELSGVFVDNRIAENFLAASPDGRWVVDRVQRGDGGEWQTFVRKQNDGEWQMIFDVADKVVAIALAGDSLFALSLLDAPHGRVLRIPLSGDPLTGLASRAEEVIPHGTVTIELIAATRERLWVVDIDGGPSAMRVFDHSGTQLPEVDLPDICSVDSLGAVGEDTVVWSVETFVSPRTWWLHSDTGNAPRRTGLDTVTPLDFSSMEVERVFATSKDGTRVPVNLIARAGTPKDGTAPAVLYGYGGYAISIKPWFQPSQLLWLEQGGVYTVANIRGGGEYGQEWHHAGRLETKQNCFDDFKACADHLVETGVTSRELFGILGGSNGGLLMGGVLTQAPDVAKAAVCAVPVLDALRSEITPNGEFNVTEFGTVQDPVMFGALLAYSPYHNVHDGVAYPAVLLTAGEFDPRVDAWHAKKMTARLQAATSSDAPILLRMEAGGHGMGQSLDQMVAMETDCFAFYFDQLGLRYRP